MPTKNQKVHDIAIAFITTEYKNELERRRGTKDEPVVTVQDRVSSFCVFYEEVVATLNSHPRCSGLSDD